MAGERRNREMTSAPVIAVVEDDRDTREMLLTLLRTANYQTVVCESGRDAFAMIRKTHPDLVILDLWLEHRDAGGMTLGLLELDPATRDIPVLICSAHLERLRRERWRLLERGYTLVQKPFSIDDLLAKIRALLS
jgi:DNA-binding response OmpR family regulator